ncbi:MAG TPA: GNAT family N-acetyltransferase [Chloroflexota bacterium]|nr:GNAT family N-acetyltransferase [Chloroflexota bacterium]HUM70120.1 GNAT family N-acetyltransferase [Chloroflexota bacterium]
MNEEAIWQNYLPVGFTARPSILADAAAATEVFNAAAIKYSGQPAFGLDQTINFWKSPGFDMAQSSRVILAPDGRMAAQVDVDDTMSVPVAPRIWGRVHPDYEGMGIGTAVLVWAEQRARAVFGRVPAEAQVQLLVLGIPETAVSTHQLLQKLSFRHVRDFYRMVIEFDHEPPLPVWPPGITLSNMAERPDYVPVAAAREEAFQDHWGHVSVPLPDAVENLRHWLENDLLHEPDGELLAMAGEEVAGLCLCRMGEYSDPDMGWVSVLAVRRPYRGQGLGKALLQQSFCQFYTRGFKRAGLQVDAQSLTGATRLYEKAGMRVQERVLDFEKELRPGKNMTTHN